MRRLGSSREDTYDADLFGAVMEPSCSGAKVLRVMLVEDDDVTASGLVELLSAEPDVHVIGRFQDAEPAIESVPASQPDLVIMDIKLPGCNGIEATRLLTKANPGLAVLLLTVFALEEYLVEGLRAGARGFLLKSSAPDRLAEAVRTAAAGDALVDAALMGCLIQRFILPVPTADSRLSSLTERELQVLELVAGGRSNSAIASELFMALPTVKVHVSVILAKLGLNNRVEAALLAWEAGVGRQDHNRSGNRPHR